MVVYLMINLSLNNLGLIVNIYSIMCNSRYIFEAHIIVCRLLQMATTQAESQKLLFVSAKHASKDTYKHNLHKICGHIIYNKVISL